MDILSYDRGLDEILALGQRKRYGEALAVVERLLSSFPYSPYLLVRKVILGHLHHGDQYHPGLTLEEMREGLEWASVLAPDYPQALIERGYFLYAVEDQSEQGLKQLQAAREQAESDLQEAAIGEAKCYLDLEQPAEAQAIIQRLLKLFPQNLDAKLLQSEISEYLENQR